jgi:hypothetical protein
LGTRTIREPSTAIWLDEVPLQQPQLLEYALGNRYLLVGTDLYNGHAISFPISLVIHQLVI